MTLYFVHATLRLDHVTTEVCLCIVSTQFDPAQCDDNAARQLNLTISRGFFRLVMVEDLVQHIKCFCVRVCSYCDNDPRHYRHRRHRQWRHRCWSFTYFTFESSVADYVYAAECKLNRLRTNANWVFKVETKYFHIETFPCKIKLKPNVFWMLFVYHENK